MSFDEFIKRVMEYYNGNVSIVLFGSRARGDYWESSDYDIMVFL
ncbi:nucleotidyltransferase domain-containing protein [Sulfurisphaera ohwakuensis]|uniref:Putative nucleotidyltransferase n=1 Tax=Sulfurisphaera ohwakuensis TaxID=69656 RepID=A0A7J9RWG5_SULOH|nr:nucleotidyltransferase domain-containing protein [Sulfurisphaera ohwakuensis]MBB5254836.1 putative nucleotidyltransferase [Sulfurisphaera ohwakuensis]